MHYREATLADAEAIANLHATSWRFAYRGVYSDEYLDGPVWEDRREVWTERLASPPANQFCVVAEDGGQLAGFACSFGESDEQWGALLDNLHVHPDRHRHGIGKRLVIETMKWSVRKYPGRGLFLWVLANNSRAQSFYESIGGTREDAKESPAPGGGTIVGLRYVWSTAQVAHIASGG